MKGGVYRMLTKIRTIRTAYGPVVSYCLYAVPFLLYRLFRRSLVSAAVSLPCTDVKGERFSG